jgi:spore coat polysaccharide biosynthesis protein SpsF
VSPAKQESAVTQRKHRRQKWSEPLAQNRRETEQETFWRTEFGTAYADRNVELAKAREPFFAKILALTGTLSAACELGANIGENLKCIHRLSPTTELHATEINPAAYLRLSQLGFVQASNHAIQDFQPEATFDLVFTCGVLIHLAPDDLPATYQKMMGSSHRFILVNEYFNPVPTQIPYRGHENKLYKRDFAGELLDASQGGLEVVDYGFLWRRLEPGWDDTTWTLLVKKDTQAPC